MATEIERWTVSDIAIIAEQVAKNRLFGLDHAQAFTLIPFLLTLKLKDAHLLRDDYIASIEKELTKLPVDSHFEDLKTNGNRDRTMDSE